MTVDPWLGIAIILVGSPIYIIIFIKVMQLFLGD